MITIQNVNEKQNKYSLIIKQKIRGDNSRPRYRLCKGLDFELSNGVLIEIPEGFEWDLSTTPRFLWSLLPPDGDFEVAYLIHDFLWINRNKISEYFALWNCNFNRKFADDEMLLWAKATNGTNKISLRNIDNYLRYYGVRLFGWLYWKRILKFKN